MKNPEQHYCLLHLAELIKEASIREDKGISTKKKRKHPVRIIGEGALGLGTGMLAGYGAGRLLEVITKKLGIPKGQLLPPIISAAGTGIGVGYPLWKAYEQEELRRAVESKRSPASKRFPG